MPSSWARQLRQRTTAAAPGYTAALLPYAHTLTLTPVRLTAWKDHTNGQTAQVVRPAGETQGTQKVGGTLARPRPRI
jgi:hypothetical protein